MKQCRKCGADAGGLGWRYTQLRGVGLASPNAKRVYCNSCAKETRVRLMAQLETRRKEAVERNRVARLTQEGGW